MTNELETEAQQVTDPIPCDRVEDDSELRNIIVALLAHKRHISYFTITVSLLTGLIAFLLPNTYTATAIIMPPQQPQTAVSALVGQLGPLAAVAGRDIGLKSPSDLYVGLLGSRTIADRVIERFSLQSLYGAHTMVDARGSLKGRTRFSAGKDTLIHVEVDDRDPRRAADIANAYVTELNRENTWFGTSEAGQRRLFLEKALEKEKAALAAAEESMKETQTRTGVIQVEGQTSVAIASIAQLKAQVTAGEVALQRLKMGATNQNPEVQHAEAELDALRIQLLKLQQSPRNSADPVVPTAAIPQAGLEYLRKLRDLKYHEFLFEMLSKQYEAATIDESKVAPALQVVDVAVPPDKKSGPHRGLMIAFGTLAALAMACTFVCVSARNHGIPQQTSDIRERERAISA